MTKDLDDRTLELRIIRAAAGVVRGALIISTMHDLRAAVEELARRHPKGYPAVGGTSFTVPWPAPVAWSHAKAYRPGDRATCAGQTYRCVSGRPETWPAELETATGAALDRAVAPGNPRIPTAVHSPFGSHPEPDEDYRNRLRAESRHDIGRIHGRALDVAEHTWNGAAPKGEYPATSATRALTVGIITAVFEEIERKRTSPAARVEHTYREGDEVEITGVHGPTWASGVVKHANDWGVVVYWSLSDGKLTGSSPVPWDEVRGRVRRLGEYRRGDEVEVKTGGPGALWGAVWERAIVHEVYPSLVDVSFVHRERQATVPLTVIRRPTTR